LPKLEGMDFENKWFQQEPFVIPCANRAHCCRKNFLVVSSYATEIRIDHQDLATLRRVIISCGVTWSCLREQIENDLKDQIERVIAEIDPEIDPEMYENVIKSFIKRVKVCRTKFWRTFVQYCFSHVTALYTDEFKIKMFQLF